jgi:hypothetical protein
MKDSMWKIDPVAGVQFRDPRDPDQGVLDFGAVEPDLASLIRQLKPLLRAAPQGLTVEELRDFTLFETAFRPPHTTAVVRTLLERGELGRDPEKGQLSGKVRVRLT